MLGNAFNLFKSLVNSNYSADDVTIGERRSEERGGFSAICESFLSRRVNNSIAFAI